MEPMDIDWKHIDSRFVVDDLLERINAPMWVDFSAPDESVDEAAWFCRPDCNHPKASEEIEVKRLNLVRNPEVPPLGERNKRDATLKKRGVSSAIPSLVKAKSEKITSGSPISKSMKKFRADAENENPNSTSSPSPIRPISTAKVLKDSIKSSAEKKKKTRNHLRQHFSSQASVAESPQEQKPIPRLRTTLSARNLFGGRDILNHVTDFCNELKKLAFSAKEKEKSVAAKEKQSVVEEENAIICPIPEDQKDSSKDNNLQSNVFSPETKKNRQIKKQISRGRENQLTVHPPDVLTPQVRSCPPTPQRFPSSSQATPVTPHQLRKPRTTERGVLQEVEPNKAAPKDPGVAEADNVEITKAAVVADDARPLDVFWFLKPCTYLIKS